MLGRLARLLRAAGHDTALAAPGTPDAILAAATRREGRTLLTLDRRLAETAADCGLRLPEDRPEAQARHLSRLRLVDWRLAPFTRCLLDNAPLRDAGAGEIAALLAPSRDGPGPLRICPACGRVYWPGSHVRRMSATLDRLAAATSPSSPDRP
ncbi:Mut7-C RNAse domain-containing protein [Methylobacterium oryzisoli]|uniref:Mut7-C RNAse domain-containing protein n=1 Tax=Methylobacterium oryzisoli TaxID=3385502 RepID=UPI0038918E0C